MRTSGVSTGDDALRPLLFGNNPDDFPSKSAIGIQPVVNLNFQEIRFLEEEGNKGDPPCSRLC